MMDWHKKQKRSFSVQLRLPETSDDGRRRVGRALRHGRKDSADAGVLRFFEASERALLHHRHELPVGQLSVAVLVEEDEDDVDDVIGKLEEKSRQRLNLG